MPNIEPLNETKAPVETYDYNYLYRFAETPVQREAIRLRQMGFSVGPTLPAQKIPFAWRQLTYTKIHPSFILELFDGQVGIFVVVGEISHNLTILDCETDEAARRHLNEFNRRGLEPWRVRTARGEHFWWLSADGELANIQPDALGGDAELRGRRGYCLCPGSIHPTGVLYEWIFRSGAQPPLFSIDQLDWLPLELSRPTPSKRVSDDPLRCLSRANRELIIRGVDASSNGDAIFAAACDLAGNGFSESDALEALLPVAHRSHVSMDDLERTVGNAYSKPRQPARPHNRRTSVKEDAKDVIRARRFAASHKWTNLSCPDGTTVSAVTARRVFGACIERCRLDKGQTGVFRASVREIAELANVSRNSASRALRALLNNDYLVSCGSSDVGARLMAFDKTVLQSGDNISPPGHYNTVPKCNATQDAFARGALSPNGQRVWAQLMSRQCSVHELAETLNLHRSTVYRHLETLASVSLVNRVDDTYWVGLPATVERLRDIAELCGTNGNAERRAERHNEERSVYASRVILARKREWQRRQTYH